MKVLGALLIVWLLAACTEQASTADEVDPKVPVPKSLESNCPPTDTPLRYPSGDLPEGAVAVRLCPGALTVAYTGDPIGIPVQGPADELITGVAELVDLVNGLPAFEAGSDCHFDDGPHHVYWFRYPDGDARAVAYAEGGCHTLAVGEELAYRNGERLATAFASALLDQRAQTTPPASAATETITCATPPMSEPISVLPAAAPLAMTQAVWCEGVAPYRMRSAVIPGPLLQRVNDSLLGKPTEARDRCRMPSYGQTIEGRTAWGDRVSYLVPGCRVVARTGYGRDNITTTVEADPALLAAIKALPLGPDPALVPRLVTLKR